MRKDPVGKTKDVRAAVDKELSFDPMVDAASITVRNIGGDVTLTGTVPSYPQYLAAATAARRVAGVTGVHNNLEVALPDGDFRDDVKLATAANNALAGNVTVPDAVEAIAQDGNITLTGTVAYGTERAAAEVAVAGLTGVRNVFDEIEISYVINPVDVDLHVQQALEALGVGPGRQRRDRADQGRHHHADRPRAHLGRARRGGQRCLDGPGRRRRPRRTPDHRLTRRSAAVRRRTALRISVRRGAVRRPSVGAVTLALLFGLFNLIYGTWMLAGGIELRRTGKTLRPVPSPGRKERGPAGAWRHAC